ncbi:MAG: heavy metal translocating P-type ATPase [Planctomycetota bacterium]
MTTEPWAATDTRDCAHCGLPSPRPDSPDQLAFCCSGCRGAYELIHGWGLQDYYKIRDTVAAGGSEPVSPNSDFDAFDQPEFLGRSEPQGLASGLLQCRLAVGGLHCGACSWLIERSSQLHPGWKQARVHLGDHTIQITFDPQMTRLSAIAATLSRLGYRLMPLSDVDQADRYAAENRSLLVSIAVAGFCAANAMWIAVALYAGDFSGIATQHAGILRWAGASLAVVSVIGPGRSFFRGAWASVRLRTPHMDLPVTLGLSAGVIAAVIVAAVGAGETYFDSVTTLVFFLLIGRWVQFRQQRKAHESVALMMRLTPATASKLGGDGETFAVSADSLDIGDLIRVRAGETIAADGVIHTGHSMVDRSLVTGESMPIPLGPGDKVEAGCGNVESVIDVRVEATGLETRVGKLMQLIEEAATRRTPIVQQADKIGGIFVVTVIALAVLTFIWWRTDLAAALNHSVALLIVACPCALALATPLAIAVALGRSARRGILIRGGDVFERMAKPGTIWFDKTGTLTTGMMTVTDWTGDDRALALAASVEAESTHPLAQAVLRYAKSRRLKLPVALEVVSKPGGGVRGLVDNHQVMVGNANWMSESGMDVAPAWLDRVRSAADEGSTALLVSVDDQVVASLSIADSLRSESAGLVQRLKQLGWQVGMLSGDHPGTARSVARQLGIEPAMTHGGMTPEQKLDQTRQSVDRAQDGGPKTCVVMVGDGINDAAALAAADVGIAVRGGASASLEAAPVFLSGQKLSHISLLSEAAQRTVRTIHWTFALSLAYNVLAAILAMTGLISPLIAAILMPVSSLTVVSLVLAIPTFPPGRS